MRKMPFWAALCDSYNLNVAQQRYLHKSFCDLNFSSSKRGSKMRSVLSALVVLAIVAGPVATLANPNGVTPGAGHVQVYFDPGLTVTSQDCPGVGLQTLYVGGKDWQAFVTGVEYKVVLPPTMLFLGDFNKPPVNLGTSVTGIGLGFGIPKNGFVTFFIHEILVVNLCGDCSNTNTFVSVVPHPASGKVRITDFPAFAFKDGEGANSFECKRAISADLDIKPGSCPNPLNSQLFGDLNAKNNKGGVITIALLGGSLDLSQVCQQTININGLAPLGGGQAPELDDVSTEDGNAAPCDCIGGGGDGILDLKMKYDSGDLAQALGGSPNKGQILQVDMTFTDLSGLCYVASDCIKVVGNANPGNLRAGGGPTMAPAFPNPFNPVTQISYSLPEAQEIYLAAYDVSGRLVEVLYSGFQEAGDHLIEWHADHLPSGVYFYRLKASGETFVRSVTLLK